MKKNILIKILILLIGITSVFSGPKANAQSTEERTKEYQNQEFHQVENQLFPGWNDDNIANRDDGAIINGVIGESGDDQRIFQYIPRIIDLILKITSPIVVVLVLIAGTKLVMGGDDEEARTQAKDFFTYAAIGAAFMILSYSIMKTVYFLLSTG